MTSQTATITTGPAAPPCGNGMHATIIAAGHRCPYCHILHQIATPAGREAAARKPGARKPGARHYRGCECGRCDDDGIPYSTR